VTNKSLSLAISEARANWRDIKTITFWALQSLPVVNAIRPGLLGEASCEKN
jgi:hypothetical protein